MGIKPKTAGVAFLVILCFACGRSGKEHTKNETGLSATTVIIRDSSLDTVKQMALEVIKDGFNAGAGYQEVWIRDYNTFINLAAHVHTKELLKENLRVFFRLQGNDGNIVDGFIPKQKAKASEGGYEYVYTDLEENYAGHKNTVETDQETSLVQAVYKYIKSTGDTHFLQEKTGGKSIESRMEMAMQFLLEKRFNEKYGLVYGATTADWGDVQPEHEWGVYITEDTHYAMDIYDNAMFLIALDNLMDMAPSLQQKWRPVRNRIAENTMKYLWDDSRHKFIPHLYTDDSPFPPDFDENEIYYHGGTAVAIEAGLLSKEEIKISLQKMTDNVKKSGAASIGLTLYPPYPEGYFKNRGMHPYGYQNGGDWTWFGGRMIKVLIENGYEKEAREQLRPMIARVIENKGFYEWYSVDNEPRGSATFKGSAGVLFDVIQLLRENE
ncbi:hypothetical protein ED312_21020 [Sinomicrobium pectinilyticum]|uniref:Glycosyl hydrolase 94 catalytic domain-containing protein n=1 Tax=Sinomicrobium pectinilyticum TaxID=1084421 RepID=A0A3N0DP35_SINP1|nr:hypothetical protein ED312_21020 [Sinomicrobium pectinilyticum]